MWVCPSTSHLPTPSHDPHFHHPLTTLPHPHQPMATPSCAQSNRLLRVVGVVMGQAKPNPRCRFSGTPNHKKQLSGKRRSSREEKDEDDNDGCDHTGGLLLTLLFRIACRDASKDRGARGWRLHVSGSLQRMSETDSTPEMPGFVCRWRHPQSLFVFAPFLLACCAKLSCGRSEGMQLPRPAASGTSPRRSEYLIRETKLWDPDLGVDEPLLRRILPGGRQGWT